MKRTLLAALHLIGATIFVVFMIARTAQAIDGAPGDIREVHILVPTGSIQPA